MLGVIVLGMVAASGAGAAPKVARIHYAEAINLPGLPNVTAAGRPKPESVQTSFEAYGRRFDLLLESNERILHALPSANRNTLPAHALYAGVLSGLPGSWVRLARLEDGVRGLIFDGTDLYVVAPAGTVAGELDAAIPGVTAGTSLIFRAADSESGLGPDFCKVLTPGTGFKASGPSGRQPDYKAVFNELQSFAPEIAAALPTKELDLALVADTQFAAQFANPTGEMLARLNNVDGIFSAQVGVKVTSSYMQVLTSNGGMTSTAPETLLDQFESYRKVTPEAASRGLAHLMTGRDLDGPTVGISYMSTVCAPQFAVSLSQTYLDTYYSSLVAAHEIGHNFGAPHDGVAGACLTTPQTYLMSPTINGSSTFSACSLGQISPVVSAASCLAQRSVADVAAEIASSNVTAYTGDDVHVPVDVVARGTTSANDTLLTLTWSGYATVVGASVTGGTCASSAGTWTCQLGTLVAGERRQVDVVVRSSTLGNGTLTATATATSDADASNNADSVNLSFATPAGGSVTASPAVLSALVGETQAFSATVANSGPRTLENAVVTMRVSLDFTVLSASGSAIACATAAPMTTCTVGSVPAGESRRIDFVLRGTRAGRSNLMLTLNSSNDTARDDDFAGVTVTAFPLVELTLSALDGAAVVPIGNTITRSFLIRSTGPHAADGATFAVNTSSELDIQSVTGAGASCAPDPASVRQYRCSYATAIESGGTRQVDVQLRGQALGVANVNATVSSPDNQHLTGTDPSRAQVSLQVRSMVDVAMARDFVSDRIVYDHLTSTIVFDMTSIGATPAENSRFHLALPANLRATATWASRGSCTFTVAAVDCQLGTMETGDDAHVGVEFVGDLPGRYTLAPVISADGDTVPSNDSQPYVLAVLPNTDVAVSPLPLGMHVRPGTTFEETVVLTAATQPLSGTRAVITVDTGLTILSGVPSQGACALTAGQLQCDVGAVPALGNVNIVVRLRADTYGAPSVRINASADNDINITNNSVNQGVMVDPRGDVALSVASNSLSADVGATIDLPRFTVAASSTADDVTVDLTVPSAFAIVSVTADGAPCSINAGVIACTFGLLEVGPARNIAVRLRTNQAGTFTITGRAAAADDANLADNQSGVTVTVNRSGSSSNGSSGGGGGALDPATLALLMLVPAALHRRRKLR